MFEVKLWDILGMYSIIQVFWEAIEKYIKNAFQ